MLKALFLAKHLRVGGAQRLWAILLPALRERRIDARLVTLEGKGEFYDEVVAAGVPASCLGMRARLDVPALQPLFRRNAFRPDVIVSYDERPHLAASLLARRLRVPHVACDYCSPGYPWKIHRSLILSAVGGGLAAAVTVCDARGPDLVSHRVRPERLRTIPNGVVSATFRPARTREDVRAELGLDDGDFVALLPSVLRPEKRPERFVEAVAIAHAEDPRVRGLVAGYGPLEDAVRSQAAALGSAVQVLGHRGDIPDLIEASDAVCLTSDLEAAPCALLEGMSLERPVVAMRAGSLDEVIVDGETGELVPAGDVPALAAALVSLARDPDRASALAQAGRDRQRALYDADVMCDAYAELLRELVATRSSTAASASAATVTE